MAQLFPTLRGQHAASNRRADHEKAGEDAEDLDAERTGLVGHGLSFGAAGNPGLLAGRLASSTLTDALKSARSCLHLSCAASITCNRGSSWSTCPRSAPTSSKHSCRPWASASVLALAAVVSSISLARSPRISPIRVLMRLRAFVEASTWATSTVAASFLASLRSFDRPARAVPTAPTTADTVPPPRTTPS